MTEACLQQEENLVLPVTQEGKNETLLLENQSSMSIKDCIKKISVIAFPTTLFYICIYLQQTMILSFIGRKYGNEKMVSGIGISNLYCNCFVIYLAVGLISGCDTICSNAYSLKKYYLLGLYVHRSRLITLIIICGLCVFHYFFAIKLISLLGIDKQVIHYASEYINFNLIYGIMEIQFGLNFRIINIADKSIVNIFILIVSIALHPLWCHIFINVLDLAVTGAGIAFILSQFINTSLTSLYLHFFHPIPESYFCLNKDCFKGWWEYLKFAIPAAILLCSEWLSFEIQGIFAVFMTAIDYETYILIYNLVCLLYTLVVGFYMATTILVGKFIANDTISNLKRISIVCIVYGFILMTIAIIPVLILQGKVLYIYINNKEIIELGGKVINYMCAASVLDMAQTILCSICRGLGQQILPSVFAFFQFYILQTFLTWLLGIHYKYGVVGIFMSSSIGLAASFICFLLIILRFNFKKIKDEVIERIRKDELMS